MCEPKTAPTLATTPIQRVIRQLFAPQQQSEKGRSELIKLQSESCTQLCIQVRERGTIKVKIKSIKIWSKSSGQKATADY